MRKGGSAADQATEPPLFNVKKRLLVVGGQREQRAIGAVRLIGGDTEVTTDVDSEIAARSDHPGRAAGVKRHAVDRNGVAAADQYIAGWRRQGQANRLAGLAEAVKTPAREGARRRDHAAASRANSRIGVDRDVAGNIASGNGAEVEVGDLGQR